MEFSDVGSHLHEDATMSTRWSTTLSSKVNLPHAINFRALCGANLVTSRSKFRPNETCELHRADGTKVTLIDGTVQVLGSRVGINARLLRPLTVPLTVLLTVPKNRL